MADRITNKDLADRLDTVETEMKTVKNELIAINAAFAVFRWLGPILIGAAAILVSILK